MRCRRWPTASATCSRGGGEPEQRVIIALPDGPEFVAALFGTLKIGRGGGDGQPGAQARRRSRYFFEYTRAPGRLVAPRQPARRSRRRAPRLRSRPACWWSATGTLARRLAAPSPDLETFPTHRDDAGDLALLRRHDRPAQGGRRRRHRSFANTTRRLRPGRPRLTRGRRHALGAQALLRLRDGLESVLPVRGRRAVVLFPEPATAESSSSRSARHRPTVLINVPTMINQMVSHPDAARQDLSSLRLATSAGEALPAELLRALEGDASASSCSTGSAPPRCGTSSSRTVPARCAPARSARWCRASRCRSCDDEGRELPAARSAGSGCAATRARSATGSRWRRRAQAFRGEWYVSGDLIATRRRRLLHLLRPRRRACSRSVGQVAGARRGGGLPAPAPGRLRGGGGRGRRRERPREAARVRGRAASSARAWPRSCKRSSRERLEPYKAPREVVFVTTRCRARTWARWTGGGSESRKSRRADLGLSGRLGVVLRAEQVAHPPRRGRSGCRDLIALRTIPFAGRSLHLTAGEGDGPKGRWFASPAETPARRGCEPQPRRVHTKPAVSAGGVSGSRGGHPHRRSAYYHSPTPPGASARTSARRIETIPLAT